MKYPPIYLTPHEKERWVYAEGMPNIHVLSREISDLEDEAEELRDENWRQSKEIDVLEEEIISLTECTQGA